ncbi:MAG: hypothetical protein ACRCUY_07050 [Thermoguttaceae bacterium]
MDREQLLGYLLNALDDVEMARLEREIVRHPALRAELGHLRVEIFPLTKLEDSVEPPVQLAKRTCQHIWEQADENTFLPFSSPNTCSVGNSGPSPLSDKLSAKLTDNTRDKRLLRRSDFRQEHHRKTSQIPKKSHSFRRILFDLSAAAFLGVLIAFVSFHLIQFVNNRAKEYIARGTLKAVNRNMIAFDHIRDDVLREASDTSLPVNLARSAWQEWKPTNLSISSSADNYSWTPISTVQRSSESPNLIDNSIVNWNTEPGASNLSSSIWHFRKHPLTEQEVANISHSDDTSNSTLFSSLLSTLPTLDHLVILGEDCSLQTGYGRDVLLQNGRIFFRELPAFTPPETEIVAPPKK